MGYYRRRSSTRRTSHGSNGVDRRSIVCFTCLSNRRNWNGHAKDRLVTRRNGGATDEQSRVGPKQLRLFSATARPLRLAITPIHPTFLVTSRGCPRREQTPSTGWSLVRERRVCNRQLRVSLGSLESSECCYENVVM